MSRAWSHSAVVPGAFALPPGRKSAVFVPGGRARLVLNMNKTQELPRWVQTPGFA